MNSLHNPKVTAAEIAALWTQYLNDSSAICIHKHMMEHLEDEDIRRVFEDALSLSHSHLEKIKEFLVNEGFPVPVGFTENDVISNQPRLFSDVFCLHYLNIMSIYGSHAYSGALTTSSRYDIREYFTRCNATAIELCNRTKNVLQEKGIYFRPPSVLPPDKPDFVNDHNFIAGFLGEKRPLTCIEITDIYFNLKKSILAKALSVAFSQVTPSKTVRNFLLKAVDTKDEHIQMFNDVLNKDNLPTPPTFDAEITNSIASPFSDKLMMFHVGFLFTTAMTYYGAGWVVATRRDLSPKYATAIAGDIKIGSKCLDIMIDNAWLEQPPLAEDREALAKINKE